MGKSALYVAVENGRMNVATLLLDKEGSAGQANVVGITPLMEASRSGNYRLIQTLLEKGADINVIQRPELGYTSDANGGSGMTALMFAARGGHQAAVAVLINAGAQTTVTNAGGKRAVDEAADNGYDNIVQLFSHGSGNAVTAQVLVTESAPEKSSSDNVTVYKYQAQ
jgi:ankyrin repeat protein